MQHKITLNSQNSQISQISLKEKLRRTEIECDRIPVKAETYHVGYKQSSTASFKNGNLPQRKNTHTCTHLNQFRRKSSFRYEAQLQNGDNPDQSSDTSTDSNRHSQTSSQTSSEKKGSFLKQKQQELPFIKPDILSSHHATPEVILHKNKKANYFFAENRDYTISFSEPDAPNEVNMVVMSPEDLFQKQLSPKIPKPSLRNIIRNKILGKNKSNLKKSGFRKVREEEKGEIHVKTKRGDF